MHRLADLALVAVGRRGVDVAVPGVECRADGVAGLVRGRLEHSETERGRLDTVVEGDGFHVRHPSTVGWLHELRECCHYDYRGGRGVLHQDIGDRSLKTSATRLLGDRRHR